VNTLLRAPRDIGRADSSKVDIPLDEDEAAASPASARDRRHGDAPHVRAASDADATDGSDVAMAIVHGDALVHANEALERLLGLRASDCAGRIPWEHCIHPDERDRVLARIAEAQTRRLPLTIDFRLAPDRGSALIRLAGAPGGAGASYIHTLVAIGGGAELAPARRRPEPVAARGELAGHPVLEQGIGILREAWRKSDMAMVLAIGVTCAAQTLSAADQARLDAALADRLRRFLRAGDAIGCCGNRRNFGLVAVLAGVQSPQLAASAAGRLIEKSGAALELDGRALPCPVHIGVALYPDDDYAIDGLLDHAGFALDLARHAGPGRFSFAETSLNAVRDAAATEWTDKLALGVAEFDRPHRRLFQHLSALHRDAGRSPDPEVLKPRVVELMHLLQADFVAEQTALEAAGSRFASRHRADHEALARSVVRVQRAGSSLGMVLAAALASEWLARHIPEYDAPLLRAL
jgi:hemerythrin-like metal-binding protein